jgi:hypothetical protein
MDLIPSRLVITTTCLLALFLTAGCAGSQQLTIETVNEYDTYNTPTSRLLSSQDASFQWGQLEDRIQRELSQQVPEMGLSYSRTDAQLSFYTYGLTSSLAQQPILPYQATGYDAAGNRIPPLTELEANSLVMDIVDPVNNRLIWRGTVSVPFHDAEQTNATLPNAIRVLLAKASKALSSS